jgi:hypothetical protein
MYMSEHEKFEQVGRLAEEYSHLKGQLNLVTPNHGYANSANPEFLLGHHELLEAFRERERLTGEVNEVAARLKALAPHLLP